MAAPIGGEWLGKARVQIRSTGRASQGGKGLKKHIKKNLSKELIKLVMGSNPDPDHNLSTTLSDGTILLVNPD